MLVSYRQPLGYREPLRVGWAQYGRLWLDHHTNHLLKETLPVSEVVNGAAAEIRWIAALTASSMAVRIDRMRPRPWSDRKLLWVILVTGIGALAVAGVLGFALSQWMMTRTADLLPAAGGAVAVGVVLLMLMYLVFASKSRVRSGER